jgi:hypothetical protein
MLSFKKISIKLFASSKNSCHKLTKHIRQHIKHTKEKEKLQTSNTAKLFVLLSGISAFPGLSGVPTASLQPVFNPLTSQRGGDADMIPHNPVLLPCRTVCLFP